jgi:transposase-like protein
VNSESRIDPDEAENIETAASLESKSPNMSDENNVKEERPRAGQSRRYSSEEVADIIRISLRDEARRADDTVDYEELLAIAAEMGVHKDQITRAVHLLEEEQLAHDKESELYVRFKTHGFLFIAVNLLCVSINVLGNSSTFWSMYVLFGWGLFLLGHYAGLRYAPQFVEMAMDRTRQLANNHYQAMFEDDANIGFTSSDSTGMSQTEGIASIAGEKLILEHQTMDAFLGLLQSSIKIVEIPVQHLSNIRL